MSAWKLAEVSSPPSSCTAWHQKRGNTQEERTGRQNPTDMKGTYSKQEGKILPASEAEYYISYHIIQERAVHCLLQDCRELEEFSEDHLASKPVLMKVVPCP